MASWQELAGGEKVAVGGNKLTFAGSASTAST